MSKTVRRPKPRGPSVAETLKRLEGRVRGLESAQSKYDARLAKVEVVKAGPQEPDVAEPELPFEAQKPETE